MKRKGLVVVVMAAFMTSGCVSSAKRMDATMASWEGRPVMEAAKEYGLPDAVQSLDNGNTGYTWTKERIVLYDPFALVKGPMRGGLEASGAGQRADVRRCAIVMIANPQGIILDADWFGACR